MGGFSFDVGLQRMRCKRLQGKALGPKIRTAEDPTRYYCNNPWYQLFLQSITTKFSKWYFIYCNDKHETNISLQELYINYFTIYCNDKYETIIYYNEYILAVNFYCNNIYIITSNLCLIYRFVDMRLKFDMKFDFSLIAQ